MRKLIGFWAALLTIATASIGLCDEDVRRYVRGDETYVAAYWRHSQDGNPDNNFSFPGNLNSDTGKVDPGTPDTYLQPFYNPKSDDFNQYRGTSIESLTMDWSKSDEHFARLLSDTTWQDDKQEH